MYRQSERNLLNSNIFSTCHRNMANFGLLTAEIDWQVWGTPANFNRFPSWLCYCSDVVHRRPTKLCTMFGRLLGWYTLYIFFQEFLPPTEFCQVQNSLYVQVFRSAILAVLLHGTPAADVSQTLRYGTRNGITELSQRAPPIFDRAAIMLGIGHILVFILYMETFPRIPGGSLDYSARLSC